MLFVILPIFSILKEIVPRFGNTIIHFPVRNLPKKINKKIY